MCSGTSKLFGSIWGGYLRIIPTKVCHLGFTLKINKISTPGLRDDFIFEAARKPMISQGRFQGWINFLFWVYTVLRRHTQLQYIQNPKLIQISTICQKTCKKSAYNFHYLVKRRHAYSMSICMFHMCSHWLYPTSLDVWFVNHLSRVADHAKSHWQCQRQATAPPRHRRPCCWFKSYGKCIWILYRDNLYIYIYIYIYI